MSTSMERRPKRGQELKAGRISSCRAAVVEYHTKYSRLRRDEPNRGSSFANNLESSNDAKSRKVNASTGDNETGTSAEFESQMKGEDGRDSCLVRWIQSRDLGRKVR